MNNIYDIMTQNVNGATFIGVDTCTAARLKGGKKNPHVGNVQKHQEGSSVMVFQNKTGSSYDKMVKRRLEKEGKNPENFRLSPRTWGTRIPNTPFIEHNGQYYLEVIFLKPGDVTYMYEGKPIAAADVQGLEHTEETGEQGGLNDKVIIRTFKISSLTQIRINKQTFHNLYFEMPQSSNK